MPWRPQNLDAQVTALDRELGALRPALRSEAGAAIDRWRADAAALLFHLRRGTDPRLPPLVAVLGGTGTGKSTLVNRLLGHDLSATSIRRTFTSGAVAFVADASHIPEHWLGVEAAVAGPENLPARGQPDQLAIVPVRTLLTERLALVDTPDLDGDTPAHHHQADRAFRWASAIVFLVTPEKYQMTELLPYYRMAQRYRLPALFVMNKVEHGAVLDDYSRLLEQRQWPDQRPFALARDDAAYEPPPQANLQALRQALIFLPPADEAGRRQGLARRTADLLGRLTDQIVDPLRSSRAEVELLAAALKAMETPETQVDVNPLTRQLELSLRQRSVLYLMGPGRMIERVRQGPGLLMRLPRTLWDAIVKGQVTLGLPKAPSPDQPPAPPDFRAMLMDQFAIVQSRLDDALRSSPVASRWLADNAASYTAARMDPQAAGTIVDQELAALNDWLRKHWNATPRDTALLMKFLRLLPGGHKLAQWTEAAPYLLTVIVVAAHHATFGTITPLTVGGFALATWLTEKLSNEVSAQARATNRRISDRFTALAHVQIQRIIDWLDLVAPPSAALDRLADLGGQLARILESDL